MPAFIRLYIKTAIVYLVTGLFLGSILGIREVLNMPHYITALIPVYFHLLMVGWVTQLIFGMAFWMFPKYSKERPRGYEGLAVITYISLNIGLLLRAIGEPMNSISPDLLWGLVLFLSALLQWIAGLTFMINIWGRIKLK